MGLWSEFLTAERYKVIIKVRVCNCSLSWVLLDSEYDLGCDAINLNIKLDSLFQRRALT